MIRCLLVDDDRLAVMVMERFIGADPGLELVGSCGSLAESRTMLAGGGVDLLFLDNDLPDGSGLALLRSGVPLPPTLLVTGSAEVATQAVAAGAAAALTKPFSLPAFRAAVERARRSTASG